MLEEFEEVRDDMTVDLHIVSIVSDSGDSGMYLTWSIQKRQLAFNLESTGSIGVP